MNVVLTPWFKNLSSERVKISCLDGSSNFSVWVGNQIIQHWRLHNRNEGKRKKAERSSKLIYFFPRLGKGKDLSKHISSIKHRKIRSGCNHKAVSMFVFITTCMCEPKSDCSSEYPPFSSWPQKKKFSWQSHCISARCKSMSPLLWNTSFIYL